ncbi:hypothetical protein OQH61_01655 [Helicobacter sp. MIT 21-1697]|uniref:hypothetical protein n=1 Tax=Helicobacter sp. MIT 21-1697 TaxID=2993733 RepID=UPI00224B880E|nr:hypothetical protein [Helicobacter sp. MIT 21-1697]MCX2716444.1 hypothetical protein [Helicobacter sp. MIT 21-1697]
MRILMNCVKKLLQKRCADETLNKTLHYKKLKIKPPTKLKPFEWQEQKLKKKGYKGDEIYKIIINTATNPINQKMSDKPQKCKEDLPTPREAAERENLNYLMWCDKEWNEDDEGNMRWEFELWNFGYEDALNLCGAIWTIFDCNIVLLDFYDLVETKIWRFSINDMPCLWYFNDFPAYHYIIPFEQTQENCAKLEGYMKILVDELNRIAIEKIIEPY